MSVVNTGRVIYTTLQQVLVDTGSPTGTTKTNDPNDPDYIPPFVDDTLCPPPTTPVTPINQLQISIVNQTGQSLGWNSLLIGPLSGQSAGASYYNNVNFTILPNTTFNCPVVDQVDDSSYISFGVVGLSKQIRTAVSVAYQPSDNTSPSVVASFNIVSAQAVNQSFNDPRVANSDLTNMLVITLTENPVPPPTIPPAPVMTAGTAQSIQLPVNSATLNGTMSSQDPNTAAVWTQVSGPSAATIVTPTSVQTNVTGLVQGTYVFKITGSDSYGQSGSAQTQVVVNPAAVVTTGLVNILVDPSMPDTTYQITQITLYNMINTQAAPITLLTIPLTNASGVTLTTPLKGTYRMVVAIAGAVADGMSLSAQWGGGTSSPSSVSFNLPIAGNYSIDNVVVDAGSNGVLVNFSSQVASNPTLTILYAHMTTAGTTTTNTNQLPNDLIVTQNGNITVATFSDSGMTTPANFTGNISYTVTDTNNLNSTTVTTTSIQPVAAQESVVVATLQRYQHYDYSQSTPLVQDDSYTYALVAGQGYLII